MTRFKWITAAFIMTAVYVFSMAEGTVGHEGHGMKAGKTVEETQQQEKLAVQTLCPVLGGEINRKLYVDYEGQRIYVCCENCLPKVQKEPGKYIERLKEMGQVPEAVPGAKQAKSTLAPQNTCPVMGGPIDKKLYVDVDGKRFYVCCPGCIDPIKKDPKGYEKKLNDLGESVEVLKK